MSAAPAEVPTSLPIPDTVLVIVHDKTSKYVLLTREKNGSVWFPGGKLEVNETPIAAAIRELEEETGLKLSPSDLVLVSSKTRTSTHGAHHNYMIRSDVKLDLHFLKNNVISRVVAGNIVRATELSAGSSPLQNVPKIMLKPFSDPSLLVGYDPDLYKEPSERIQYGVFANWELFDKVVTPDHIGQLVIDDLGIGTPVNVRFVRDSNFHHLAKRINERAIECQIDILGSKMSDNVSNHDTPHIAFSSTVAKFMPKFTMFSEFTDEKALIKWLETTKQQLQGCNVNLNSAEAVSNTCNLITETNMADWIREQIMASGEVFPWFSFDDFEKALLENFVAQDLGNHYRKIIDTLCQNTDNSMGFLEYKREFTRMTGLMNKYGNAGDRIPPNRLKNDFIFGLIRKQFRDYMNVWIAENKDCTLFAMLEKATVICQGIYPLQTGFKRRADELPSTPRNPSDATIPGRSGHGNGGRGNGGRGNGGQNGDRGRGNGRFNGGRGRFNGNRGRFNNHRREYGNDKSGKDPDSSNYPRENRGNNTEWKRHTLSNEVIAEAAKAAGRSIGLQNHFENLKINLSPEKKERYRRENLCFKCGEKHLFDDCPKLSQNKVKGKNGK